MFLSDFMFVCGLLYNNSTDICSGYYNSLFAFAANLV